MRLSIFDAASRLPVRGAYVQRDPYFSWRPARGGVLNIRSAMLHPRGGKCYVEVSAEGYWEGLIDVVNPPAHLPFYMHKVQDHLPPWWHAHCPPARGEKAKLRVGMIDSGCGAHPLLSHVQRYHIGFQNGSAVCVPEGSIDEVGHGTHVAGLISASPCPRGSFAGALPSVELHSVRVTDAMEETYPDSEDPTIGDRVIGALEFLVELGVDMINLSLSTLSHISIREALDDALDQGVLLIAAAGNLGHNSLKFPASHHDVVAVSGFGHVDHTPPDTISHVQNEGKLNAAVAAGRTLYPGQLSNYDRKSIWFPGVGIISTFPDANGLTGRFKELDGTSMACALASGNIGALLISPEGPLDTPRCPSRLNQIRNILNQQLRDGGDGIFPVFP